MKGLSISGCFHESPKKFFKMKLRSVFSRNPLFFTEKSVWYLFWERAAGGGLWCLGEVEVWLVDIKEDGSFYILYEEEIDG